MINEFKDIERTGTFTLSPGKDIHGEITLAGLNTSLYLQDKEFFNPDDLPEQCVKGILRDQTKMSLIECVTTVGFGSSSRGKESYHFAEIFPHYVIHGDHHIGPTDKTITGVEFVVDDASTLFYDYNAFGNVIDARPFIEQIVHANALEREITLGPDPQILYFTGRFEIFAVDETVLGKISVSHNLRSNMGGSDGVYLKSTISVTTAFRETATFHDAIAHTFTLLNFLDLLAGRPQNLLKLNLHIESDMGQPDINLKVYCSMPPRREPSHEARRPQPSDVLLDAVQQPGEFSQVLKHWLSRNEAWHDARQRFFNSFSNQRHYSIDRLIGSANMFDILPDSAVPKDVELNAALKTAKDGCRNIFKQLGESIERNSVLSCLGRLGKSSLKHKIQHRGKILLKEAKEIFPELFLVTHEAVNCRNHYVHGSKSNFDYSNNFDTVIFFANTLEFVFAASDLIEAGWDIMAWSKTGTSTSHPFSEYRINYAQNLRQLKALLKKPPVSG